MKIMASQDLKVIILSKTMISPKDKKDDKQWMFLSNIDKVLNFDVQTVTFFHTTAGLPRESVVDNLRSGIESVLGLYYSQAGRLGVDPADGRLAIDCNGSGVGFCVAESEVRLEELGSLEYPNSAFKQLVAEKQAYGVAGVGDFPLTTFQVTWFKCGAFSLGIRNNHVTFDGLSFRTFLSNIAAAAAAGECPATLIPCHDRRLLAARSPPKVAFEHTELVPLAVDSASLFDVPVPNMRYHLFSIASGTLSDMKARCQEGTGRKNPTGFNVVAAHLWRCKVLSSDASRVDQRKDHISTVAFAMDIRRRLNPRLPNEYAGNAVLTALASASLNELKTAPLGLLVDRIHEGSEKMTDEYIRSVIDWSESNVGVPGGDVLISSWWRLGFDGIEFPWGKPVYSCPVVDAKRDIVVLLPTVGSDDGVNCLVPLVEGCVEEFEHLFYKYLQE